MNLEMNFENLLESTIGLAITKALVNDPFYALILVLLFGVIFLAMVTIYFQLRNISQIQVQTEKIELEMELMNRSLGQPLN